MRNTNTNTNSIDDIINELEKESKIEIKIALFGQPGAGKSSLINALVGKNVVDVSTETDTTKSEGEVPWGEDNSNILTDLPGYGTSKFPAGEYWDRFNLDEYDLFICVFSGKFHQADDQLFHKIIEKKKPCFFVSNKSDSLVDTTGEKSKQELKEAVKNDIKKRYGEVKTVFTSCVTREGLDELVNEIYARLDDTKKEKWERNAKAYSLDFLKRKREACEKIVISKSLLAAANGLNPVPGLNLAIDLNVLQKLFKEVRKNFDLTDERIKKVTKLNLYPNLANIGNNIIRSLSYDGIVNLLQKQAGKQIAQKASRYIPLIGIAISAAGGYTITYLAGKSYLNDCYELAEAILKEELNY
ncbi:small GTP-binding protein [Virgibacillus halotolerans]|uniref:GTPase domain-containing protein n=1 Tax=Virgibacillus halotolerans TaxID=1071053 RepID=UPI001960FD65|nr:GTPase domain-containing protein [Virgibacillus halotolerans]MBM7600955.1 small GTP-binding protein [Virgibacillus halotolerans]